MGKWTYLNLLPLLFASYFGYREWRDYWPDPEVQTLEWEEAGPWRVTLAHEAFAPGKRIEVFLRFDCGECVSLLKRAVVVVGSGQGPLSEAARFRGHQYNFRTQLIFPDSEEQDTRATLTLEGWDKKQHRVTWSLKNQ
ncbi:MAG: hypothetical protein AB1671_04440 [Thermodesulfobacteriota bacterium]|jgi:hypothetical protein